MARSSDLSPTYVALDLETTGLNPDLDAIIEIGAVKFQGHSPLATFEALVNPYRDIPQFIQRLTGIVQGNVNGAPPFAAVAGELSEFVGSLPLVGHNISFDLSFLSRHGVQLNNQVFDTWDLADVLLPRRRDYSLSGLAVALEAEHSRPHRALSDAQATQGVFLSLLERLATLDPGIVAYMHHLASRAQWPLRRLFEGTTAAHASPIGLMGLDVEALAKRLGRGLRPTDEPAGEQVTVEEAQDSEPRKARGAGKGQRLVDSAELAAYLAPGGLFSRSFPGFEHRPEQVEMMSAVATALNRGEHLVAEAGTGVGKSLAYLLPALIHCMRSGTRVVVSTNTLNLQEQLLQKDIPALVRVLEGEGVIPSGEFRAVPLKGRANYFCLRRWNLLGRGETLSKDEARLLSKALVWLQDTATGDRGEINIRGKDSFTWSRISAGEKGRCPGLRGEGPCFLRTARDRADKAHMIIVNHALLLSDLALGGGLLPDYQSLIIDEAHQLEEEATRQLGFQVSQGRLDDDLDALGRLLSEARVLIRGSSTFRIRMEQMEELVTALEPNWSKRMRDGWEKLWRIAENFLNQHQQESEDQRQLRITRSTRAQPGWSDVEIAWENVDVSLAEGTRLADRLGRFLDTASSGGPMDPEALRLELADWQEGVDELRVQLKTLLAAPSEERRIDWISRVNDGRGDASGGSYIVLNSAPLNVGPELDERLFKRKDSVILTSATLSSQSNFDYMRERIGLAESGELLVGSPFDYRRAALLLIPDDIPTPASWGYQQVIEKVLAELGKALKGHTLVLFTSHSALRGVARAIRGPLEAEGIRVLAQGVDGSPARIVQSFSDNPGGVILGTSSFWGGVDLSGGLVKALVLTRLPFHVPTEPIFAARSAEYEGSFDQYALPQAVLRFRQGFGRLIRGSQDKGAIIVLDRRIVAKPYGKVFLDSIPPCTLRMGPASAIPGHAVDWVGKTA